MSLKEYSLVYECKEPLCKNGYIDLNKVGTAEAIQYMYQMKTSSVRCPDCEQLEKMPKKVELQGEQV